VLIPRAILITPNLPEAARLTGLSMAESEDAMILQGRALMASGAQAVLMKGGHASGPESVDLLITASGIVRLVAPRSSTRNTHGTGCSLSSAIAAHLARGFALEEAVERSKVWLSAAIAKADTLSIGHGAGPVHHFHALWDQLS
jgi:hydroxymethylpyrimidine/phosphomethylpyrimidine kinase